MNLFQLGDFKLHSGEKSSYKIECDALTNDDWKALASIVFKMVGLFSSVEGVPEGGLKLAKELSFFVSNTGPHLIVDDVLTTGASMEALWQKNLADSFYSPYRTIDGKAIVGVVIFARGPCLPWIRPLFQIHERLW